MTPFQQVPSLETPRFKNVFRSSPFKWWMDTSYSLISHSFGCFERSSVVHCCIPLVLVEVACSWFDAQNLLADAFPCPIVPSHKQVFCSPSIILISVSMGKYSASTHSRYIKSEARMHRHAFGSISQRAKYSHSHTLRHTRGKIHQHWFPYISDDTQLSCCCQFFLFVFSSTLRLVFIPRSDTDWLVALSWIVKSSLILEISIFDDIVLLSVCWFPLNLRLRDLWPVPP